MKWQGCALIVLGLFAPVLRADELEDLEGKLEAPASERRLKELAKDRDEVLRVRALLLLARLDGKLKPEKGAEHLKAYAAITVENLTWPRCLALAENARLFARIPGKEGLGKAIALALAKAKVPGPALAAELEGDLQIGDKLEASIASWKEALVRAGEMLPDKGYLPEPDQLEAKRLAARCRAKIAAAEKARELALCGEAALLYREARRAHAAASPPPQGWSPDELRQAWFHRSEEQNSRDMARARQLYAELQKRFPGSQLAAAAEFHALDAWPLAEIGDKQLDALEAYAKKPDALHAGEAWLALGHFATLCSFEHERAERAWANGLAWVLKTRRSPAPTKVPSPPPAGAEFTKPPESYLRLREDNSPGGAVYGETRPETAPGQLINRFSAPWYCDWLEVQLRRSLFFAAGRRDDWDQARAQAEQIAAIETPIAQYEHQGALQFFLQQNPPHFYYSSDKFEAKGIEKKHLHALYYIELLDNCGIEGRGLDGATQLRRYAARHKLADFEILAAFCQSDLIQPEPTEYTHREKDSDPPPYSALFADILKRYETGRKPEKLCMLYRAMGTKQSPHSIACLEKALAIHTADDIETLETMGMMMVYCQGCEDGTIRIDKYYERHKNMFTGKRREQFNEEYQGRRNYSEKLALDRRKENEKQEKMAREKNE